MARNPQIERQIALQGSMYSYINLPPPHGSPNCRCVAYFEPGLPLKSEDACAEGGPITTREIDRG